MVMKKSSILKNRILAIVIALFIAGNSDDIFAAGKHVRTAKVKKAQAARAGKKEAKTALTPEPPRVEKSGSTKKYSKKIFSAEEHEEQQEEQQEKKVKREGNSDLIKAAIDEKLKDYDLKYLDAKVVKTFIDYLLIDKAIVKTTPPNIVNYDLSEDGINLSACTCHSIISRIVLTLCQLNRISQKYPDKSQPFVHTSIFSGPLLQTYILAYGLLLCGYKNITLNCIDRYELYYKELFTKAQTLFTKLASSHGATINLVFFKTVYDYIDATNKPTAPALKSYSFDSIDTGGLTSKPENDDERCSLIIFERKASDEELDKTYTTPDAKNFKAPKTLDLFYCYLEHRFNKSDQTWGTRPHFFKNDLYFTTDSTKKQQEETLQKLKKLGTKTYNNVSEILALADPILKAFDTTLKPVHWCYQPFDFRAIVKYGQANSNPIIFEGDPDQLEQNDDDDKLGDVDDINEYTFDAFEKRLDTKVWEPVMDPMGKIGGVISIEGMPGDDPEDFTGTKFTTPSNQPSDDRFKQQALEIFTEQQAESFISGSLKWALDSQEVTQEQFDELKTLAENRGNLNDFDGWSKNITHSNNNQFISDLNKAFDDKKFDEIAYKKYAQQAIKGFVKLAQQTNLTGMPVQNIHYQLITFFTSLSEISKLSKIAGTVVPVKLQALGEKLKTQLLEKYKTGLKGCDEDGLESIRSFVNNQIHNSDSYFTPEQAEEIRLLFNKRAQELGVEIILSIQEKAAEEKKLEEEAQKLA